MTTFNRGKLLRLAKAGKLIAIGTYSFDDMLGETRSKKEMPVLLHDEKGTTYKEGYCYVWEDDFTSDVGRATLNENGTVHLRVHSNCSYDFKIIS